MIDEMADDLIRRHLMLHPDEPIDMTEYVFPLQAVKRLLEAGMAAERKEWQWKIKLLYKEYDQVRKHRDILLAAKMQNILEKENHEDAPTPKVNTS